MDMLSYMATVALTQDYQPDGLPEPLPLVHELTVQIFPGYSEVQSISQPFRGDIHESWNMVDDLDASTADVDAPVETPTADTDTPTTDGEIAQPSPTVFLEGEAVLGISGGSGRNFDDAVVFQESVNLILNVSFTGDDRLEVGVESGNATPFSFVDDLTFEGRLNFPSDTDDNRVVLSDLSYEFPVGDRASVYVSTTGNDLSDFNPFLNNDRNGALSEFGTENPIHHLVSDVGLQLNYDITDELGIRVGYFSDPESSADAGVGLFNGNQSAFVQLGFESGVDETSSQDSRFLLGLTYIHTYNNASLETETGSLRSQINLERPIVGNSYGLAASFTPSFGLTIGGWIGFTNATIIDVGTADIWNYALTLTFPDLGQEGNLLGIIMGQEPRLTGTSGFTIDDRRSDADRSLHIEAFYSYGLSDQLSVTPGLIWVTAPNHDTSNPDILIFTVRTTFEF